MAMGINLYWCVVTNMDLLSSPEICGGISNEWELCTPYLFETTDSLMFDLVNDTLNKLPQYAPEMAITAPRKFILIIKYLMIKTDHSSSILIHLIQG